jgi:hypothetical protein
LRAAPAPRKPRPWDPDAARGGVGLLVVGVVVSVVLHGGIPLSGVYWRPQSVTQLPVTMVLEALPLPPAEELVEAPDADDGPDEPDQPDAPDAPAEPAPDKPADKPTEAVVEPEPPPAPEPPEPAATPEPVGDAPPPPDAAPLPDADAELAARIAERDQKRAAWLAEREKRRAEREARREARRRAAEEAARRRGGGEKGGAPEAGETQGTPDDVYLCTATDKGEKLRVRTERPLTAWVPIVPTVFAHFETRPGLDAWLRRTSQVYVPRKRIGLMDFASPPEVMQMKLEQPRGVTIAVGRLDARCLVGLTYRPKLFPIKLSRVPARIVDRQNNSVAALVNITVFKDATIDIEPWNAEQPALPFSKGALQNSKAIARNIEDHYQAVRLANQFAELFGLKQKTPPKPAPKTPTTKTPTTKTPTTKTPMTPDLTPTPLRPAPLRTPPSRP